MFLPRIPVLRWTSTSLFLGRLTRCYWCSRLARTKEGRLVASIRRGFDSQATRGNYNYGLVYKTQPIPNLYDLFCLLPISTPILIEPHSKFPLLSTLPPPINHASPPSPPHLPRPPRPRLPPTQTPKPTTTSPLLLHPPRMGRPGLRAVHRPPNQRTLLHLL